MQFKSIAVALLLPLLAVAQESSSTVTATSTMTLTKTVSLTRVVATTTMGYNNATVSIAPTGAPTSTPASQSSPVPVSKGGAGSLASGPIQMAAAGIAGLAAVAAFL